MLLMLSCQESTEDNILKEERTTLFSILTSDKTGIDFINEIPENSRMNSMVYEYFYNGGGVAIGDVNNDGFSDLYFTSNLKSNKLYLNKGNFQFEDVSEKSGTKGSFGWTTGVTMVDINGDGWLDIYVCKSGKGKAENRQNELFINNKNGTFVESAESYGLNFDGYSTQAAFFDYDKDGDLDMFLLNHNVTPINTNNPENFKNEVNDAVGDKLYKNEQGKYIDVSESAGIIRNALGFGLGISIGDLNQDGWPDIYVGNDYVEQDYLYFNNGDGTFSESLKTSVKHTSNFSMGSDIADFNNDGLLDIMSLDMVAEDNYGIKTSMSGMNPASFKHAVDHGFHYQYMFNTLQLNNGQELFSEIAQLAGISNTDWSWAPLFADFDNDGFKDLFVSNGLKRDFRNNDFRKLKLNRLEKAQENQEKLAPVIEELVSATPQRKTINYFFKNNGDLTFEKVSKTWGIENATFSNGAAYADLDNDGDLDLVVNNIDEAASILKNESKGNHLRFRLKGNSKNTYGIGATILLETDNGKQIVENYSTRGYQSAVEPILHFGLNELKTVNSATITWSDGAVEVINELSVNQTIELQYSNAKVPNESAADEIDQIFVDVTKEYGINHVHKENDYDDFQLESLLPHKMSQFGPALAVADINNDGLDDFYIGGSKGQAGTLYLQQNEGQFIQSVQKLFAQEREFEDVDAEFFDADNDGDLDLYVVSGGNEWPANHDMYQDRLYTNHNGVFEKSNNVLPIVNSSGSCVKPMDYDNDGDLDLFIGARHKPQQYAHPAKSYLLQNDDGIFKDITLDKAPQFEKLGMVTDAVWVDLNNDNMNELVVVGEWMPITIFKNTQGLMERDDEFIKGTSGWWNSIEASDIDSDGDMDFIIGNLGLNYKYKATDKEPFEIYSHDFDGNGSFDIVLGYYNQGKMYPLRGRECSSNQMPFLKEKFPTYDAFGSANLIEVYGDDKLKEALHLKAKIFASIYLENLGKGAFKITLLPNEAQLSSVNDICISDFNNDGAEEVLIAGNMYQSEVETPRNDASIGLLLSKDQMNVLNPIYATESGVYLDGDVKKMRLIKLGEQGKKAVLVAKNDDGLKLITTK